MLLSDQRLDLREDRFNKEMEEGDIIRKMDFVLDINLNDQSMK